MIADAGSADARAESDGAWQSARPMEIVLVDVAAAADLLDAEEWRAPRLSHADKARFASMASADGVARIWRAGRIATRIVLERWAGPRIRGVDFVVETGGRVRVPEPPPYFSVSHCGGLLLVAVSGHVGVGVDLEVLRPLAMPQERRQRLRHASDAMDGHATSGAGVDGLSDQAVLESWVRLEAVAKARGSGIGVLLTESGVVGDSAARLASGSLPFEVRLLEAGDGVVAAVAGPELPEALIVAPFPTNPSALQAFLAPVPQLQGR